MKPYIYSLLALLSYCQAPMAAAVNCVYFDDVIGNIEAVAKDVMVKYDGSTGFQVATEISYGSEVPLDQPFMEAFTERYNEAAATQKPAYPAIQWTLLEEGARKRCREAATFGCAYLDPIVGFTVTKMRQNGKMCEKRNASCGSDLACQVPLE